MSRSDNVVTPGGDPSVSIIVPTRNSGRTLKECLESIAKQSIRCEIIVVDNGSQDDTIQIAQTYCDKLIQGGPERSAQRNMGFSLCSGESIGYIDSDMILESKVAEQAHALLAKGNVAVVVPEYTSGVGYWTSVRAYERSMYLENKSVVEAARFFKKSVVEQLGGFNEQLTGGEDWDLEIRARQIGSVARTEAKIEHDEGRVKFLEACRKKGYYAKGYTRFAREHGIKTLISITINRPYIKSPRALISKKGIGLVALKLGEVAAMLTSMSRQLVAEILSEQADRWARNSSVHTAWNGALARISESVCNQDREDT